MLTFRKLELTQYKTLLPFFNMPDNRLCDWTPDVAFMWRIWFDTEWADANGAVIFKWHFPNIGETYSVPIGADRKDALELLKPYRPIFSNVAENELPLLREVFGDICEKDERDWYDYLYRAEDLAFFPGKSMHGQKNHLNRFNKLYPDAVFEVLSRDNLADVADFFESHIEKKPPDLAILESEAQMIREYIANYGVYRSFGGLLRESGQVIAFSLGEVLRDTLFVHIEKADTDYPGVYQKIVSEFARRFAVENGVHFINREEDIGDEGLRTSKLSYHPCELLKKYTVRTK